jgi:hypothetical protein
MDRFKKDEKLQRLVEDWIALRPSIRTVRTFYRRTEDVLEEGAERFSAYIDEFSDDNPRKAALKRVQELIEQDKMDVQIIPRRRAK